MKIDVRYMGIFLILMMSTLIIECTDSTVLQRPIASSDKNDESPERITNKDLMGLMHALDSLDSLVTYTGVPLTDRGLFCRDSLDSVFSMRVDFLLTRNDSLLEEAETAVLYYRSVDDSLLLEKNIEKVEKLSFDILVTKEFQYRKERLSIVVVGIEPGYFDSLLSSNKNDSSPPVDFPLSSSAAESSDDPRNTNHAPVLAHGDSIQKMIFEDAGMQEMTLIAYDTDGGALEWSVVVDSTVILVNSKGNDSSFVVGYSFLDNVSGVFDFKVFVSDGFEEDSIKIIVKVMAVNDEPQYEAIPEVTGDPFSSFVLSVLPNGVCTDTLDDPLNVELPFTYEWYYSTHKTSVDGVLVGEGDSLIIGDSLVGGYVYSVVSCMDDSSAVTQNKSALLGPVEIGDQAGDVLNFNASLRQYVDLPDFEIEYTKGFTIEAIVKWDVIGEGARIIEIGNDSMHNVSLDNIVFKVEEPGRLVFLHSYSPGEWSSVYADGAIQVGEWLHVAVTVDSEGVARLYKNGRLQSLNGSDETEFQLKPIANKRRTSNYIGRSTWDGENPYFDGRIDEVRIWQVRRSSAQIQGNWGNYFTDITETDDIYAVYNFNQKQGSSLIDVVGGENGHLINFEKPQWGVRLP
ncbi:MAG: LamG domain-containing protein [Fibrobacterales bacterium]